ncbi:unnamed protein product [Auanema sp. JU1783]|nr:unnamed protein product [Auanema sp. JU1783]
MRLNSKFFDDYQFCYKGLHTYNKPDFCEERVDGAIMCLCRTDYCNTIDLPDRSIPTTIQLVTCSYYGLSMNSINVAAMDTCYFEESLSFGEKIQRTGDNYGVFSLGLTNNELSLPRTPYPNSCLNFTSDNENYSYSCSCRWSLCNEKQPYTVERGKVKCYHSKSNFSKNVYCTGQYCVHTPPYGITPAQYGCISAYEEGPYKLELGLIQAWEHQLYLCNSDFCNDNVNNILASVNAFKSSSAYEAYRLSLQQTPTIRAPESRAAHLPFAIIYLVMCLHMVYGN